MAKQVIQRLIDDLDQSDADETVRFSLDGVQYEIDLSSHNANLLRNSLAPYKRVARKDHTARVVRHGATTVRRASTGVTHQPAHPPAPPPPPAPSARYTRPPSVAPVDPSQTREIRAWARRKGYKIGDKGRISQEIMDRWEAEHAVTA